MPIISQEMELNVNVFQKSVLYEVNTLIQLFFEIARGRGLTPDYLTSNLRVIENGLNTWAYERTLMSAHLEFFKSSNELAFERWDFFLKYNDDPKDEIRKPPVPEVQNVCKRLASLPPGSEYRLVVTLQPAASIVEGWYATTLREIDVEEEIQIGEWGYGNIGNKIVYKKGRC